MFIYPYKKGSKSVKSLSTGLGAKIILLEGSKFKGDSSKVVINWGNSTPNDQVRECQVVNSPENVRVAANKKTFFELAEGKINIPEFTTDLDKVAEWVVAGSTVVVREKLTGNSGEGIVLIDSIEDWENYDKRRGKLFVKYILKKDEYRIHVVGDRVVMTQRKAIDKNYDGEPNFKVRNHDNGFIFVKNEDKPIPDTVLDQAIRAVEICSLDFGAVDVIYNAYRKEATVLEINTAPGLENTSVDTYVEAIKAYTNMLGGAENKESKNPWGAYVEQARSGRYQPPRNTLHRITTPVFVEG